MASQDTAALARVVADCRRKLKADPSNPQAAFDLAMALFRRGQSPEGLSILDQLVRRVPGNQDLRITYAQALISAGRLEEARKQLDGALRAVPVQPAILFKVASLYRSAGSSESSVDCFRKLVKLNPNEASAYSNLANALTRAGRFEEAFKHYRYAIKLNPQSATYHYNYGKALEEVADYDEAEATYRAAIHLDADFVDAHWALSQLLWLKGDMEAAWQYYEKRLFRRGFERRPEIFTKPTWDGRRLEGKTLLVYSEQGHGDSIQFVRYVDLIAERGARIVVECQPGLVKLFRSLKSVDQVIERGKPLPPFDVHLSMMSAPVVFNTRRHTIPGRTPYLFAQEEDSIDLPDDAGALKVGLVWAGNPSNQPADSRRSFPFSTYQDLFDLQGVEFYSLQVGEPAKQLAESELGSSVTDLGPALTDFAVTAAVVEQLDLVITSCTSMPHLVGALGKEAWLILGAIPDFRWFLEGDSSEWYPSLRLFRQQERGDWQPVINQVKSALQMRLEEKQ